MALIRWAGLLIGIVPASTVAAQTVKGTVAAAIGSTPIAHAAVRARANRVATTTDGLGRFALALAVRPDTLVVSAIGWQPDTLVVTNETELSVRLELAPTVVSDLIATAPAGASTDLRSAGRWEMPLAAARTIPPAVETDVFRALALVPAVNFSSPLSARPTIRGYDAQEVTTRIDGFEVLNLYHLGRLFSSFPADAAADLTVAAAPTSAADGGTIAGAIDITGRTGRLDRFHAGGGLSYGSLSAYAGGGNQRARAFAAARVFYWKSLELLPKADIPYHFEDLYAGVVFGPAEQPRGRVTVFATQDRAGRVDNQNYLNWDNLVFGSRWRLLTRGPLTLDLTGSAATFRQNGQDVPGLHSNANADVANRFARTAASVDLAAIGATSRIGAGVTVGWRRVRNRIADAALDGFGVADPVRSPRADFDDRRVELGAYVLAARRFGPVAFEAGARVDAAGPLATVQPRARIRWTPIENVTVSGAFGRTARLYHLLSEARSEPDLDFLDFWLSSGDSVPVAQVDHASFDLDLDLRPLVARISIYHSEGTGVGELRPDVDQRPVGFEFFRFGRSRTSGVEAQVAWRGEAGIPRSLSVSYAWARSQRHWRDQWVPWALDRRHQLRGFGQIRVGRWSLFGAADLASGMPITPLDYILPETGAPGIPAGVAIRPFIIPVYGRENSATTSGTFRLDGGLAWSFGGPNEDRFILGVSVLNLLASAVAPFGPITQPGYGNPAVNPLGHPTPYRRLFKLPPIPTLTLRAEF